MKIFARNKDKETILMGEILSDLDIVRYYRARGCPVCGSKDSKVISETGVQNRCIICQRCGWMGLFCKTEGGTKSGHTLLKEQEEEINKDNE